MKDIAIYGAGGFGREVACLIDLINRIQGETWNLIGFFDDNIPKHTPVSHYGLCLGGISSVNDYPAELHITIAIGNHHVVQSIADKITNPFIRFPNVIHPDIRISDTATFQIGKGNIIQGHCTMSCNVTIGDFNILNGSIVLGHDVQIGSFNTMMPGVRISGEVTVGNHNFFGVNSIVLQQLKIGKNFKLGAGSVLMTKPKDNMLYIGNPAKIFRY